MSDLASSLTFVIGGARSGKSTYAIRLATDLGRPTLYVATAQAIDAEMRARIRRHRARRPRSWRTLEEPLEFAQRIAAEAEEGSTVIVDCLTVWLANLLHVRLGEAPERSAAREQRARRAALAEVALLCELPEKKRFNLIVVSNEVGAGLVPPYPLGRVYRDLLGEVNQLVANAATTVMLLVAGIPLVVKESASKPDAP